MIILEYRLGWGYYSYYHHDPVAAYDGRLDGPFKDEETAAESVIDQIDVHGGRPLDEAFSSLAATELTWEIAFLKTSKKYSVRLIEGNAVASSFHSSLPMAIIMAVCQRRRVAQASAAARMKMELGL